MKTQTEVQAAFDAINAQFARATKLAERTLAIAAKCETENNISTDTERLAVLGVRLRRLTHCVRYIAALQTDAQENMPALAWVLDDPLIQKALDRNNVQGEKEKYTTIDGLAPHYKTQLDNLEEVIKELEGKE